MFTTLTFLTVLLLKLIDMSSIIATFDYYLAFDIDIEFYSIWVRFDLISSRRLRIIYSFIFYHMFSLFCLAFSASSFCQFSQNPTTTTTTIIC